MNPAYTSPLAIVTAMLVLAISDNFLWLIADAMSVWQYHALRSAMLLPFMALGLVFLGRVRSLRVRRFPPVLARSGFIVAALLCYFAAVPAVGISLAAAGLFTSPMFVALISVVFFRERVGWRRIMALILGFVGVCLVLEIATQPIRAIALAPMLGGLFYGLGVIWTRRYCRHEYPGALAFYNMSGFCLAGLLGMALTPWITVMVAGFEGTEFATMAPVWPSGPDLLVVAGMGTAAAIGMVLLAIGYSGAPPSYAALFDYSFLFWIPLFAWIIQGEVLTLPVATGMGLIVLAGMLAILDPVAADIPDGKRI